MPRWRMFARPSSRSPRSSKSGDSFLLTYAGHGSQVPDKAGDEDDQFDETWCLYDGELIDDELRRFWTQFAEGVLIYMVSDSCHSGTMLRAAEDNVDAFVEAESIARELGMPTLVPGCCASEDMMKTYERNKDQYDGLQSVLNSRPVSDDMIKATVMLLSGMQGRPDLEGQRDPRGFHPGAGRLLRRGASSTTPITRSPTSTMTSSRGSRRGLTSRPSSRASPAKASL